MTKEVKITGLKPNTEYQLDWVGWDNGDAEVTVTGVDLASGPDQVAKVYIENGEILTEQEWRSKNGVSAKSN